MLEFTGGHLVNKRASTSSRKSSAWQS